MVYALNGCGPMVKTVGLHPADEGSIPSIRMRVFGRVWHKTCP